MIKRIIPLLIIFSLNLTAVSQQMMFGDTSRLGRPFAKDPHVVSFDEKYLMYYSIPPKESDTDNSGWGIGIAESTDLNHWERIGEITPVAEYEKNGLCAPGALVRNDTIHLFYQTYGNGPKDAICHAWSADGITFERNTTNPIFALTGDWNCGRAIDAEVILFNDSYYLYYATRTPDYKTQIMGVAIAPPGTDFSRESWYQPVDSPILFPQYTWEGECTEGASLIQVEDFLYMFYAGSYNNEPQQIGVAKSKDGISWEKLSSEPFLPNGDPGTWNSSESGHPHIFITPQGETYLFFQGNNESGRTWYISNIQVFWDEERGPYYRK